MKFVSSAKARYPRATGDSYLLGPCDVEAIAADGKIYRCFKKKLELWCAPRSLSLRLFMFRNDWYDHQLVTNDGTSFTEDVVLTSVRVVVGEKYLFQWKQGEAWFWPNPNRKK